MNKLLHYRQQIIAYTAWWFGWISFWSLLGHQSGMSWEAALTDASVSNLVLALTGVLILNNYRFSSPGMTNYAYRLIFILTLSILSLLVAYWVRRMIGTEEIGEHYPGIHSMLFRFGYSFLMITLLEVFGGMRHAIQELEVNKKRKMEAELLLQEAELTRLRQQLQPHFLFNSLNSISSLALSRPAEARKMIQQLGDFLRGTLRKDDKQTISLRDELAHLKLYLDIEMVRFGHRLQVLTEAPDECLGLQIPALLLQPILENAIKYGLYGNTGDVIIRLEARFRDDGLEIVMINPVDPDAGPPSAGTGMGLSMVRRRLYLLFARQDLLTATTEGNRFVTRILIPQLL